MQLQHAVRKVLHQLAFSVSQLTQDQFVQASSRLHQGTIGQHVRHIIEFYQCLEKGYASGLVDYENRPRDQQIETDKDLACGLLLALAGGLGKENKDLRLLASYGIQDEEPLRLSTNYYREIAYNLEHTIHHMALVRIGVEEVSSLHLSEDFGVAASTLKYRSQCVQ
jgi:hypothetical protein